MKKYIWRFLFIIFTFVNIVFAYGETITLDWLNEDGTTNNTTTCTIGGDLQVPIPTKTGYDFVGWAANYIPIEYLESTGTQWIDTDYNPNNTTRALFRLQMLFPYNAVSVMGARTSMSNAAFLMNINTNGTVADYYGRTDNNICSIDNTQKIIIDKNQNITNVYDDNEQLLCTRTNSVQSFQTTPSMALFSSKAPSNPTTGAHMRIYYFKIYNNDTLVRDFIPALDPNNVPCMFDKVTGQFFYNAGTGNFIAGPIVGDQ